MLVNDKYEVSDRVSIEVEGFGTVSVGLVASEAPETVRNFTELVGRGFYDGLTFHRIMSGFMIQGGDPLGNGMGGSDKEIKGEFMSNGVNNPLSHVRGAISMARSSDPNSASSQFFIVHKDSKFLDGNYACFGYVTEGIEVVDKICEASRPVDGNGTIPRDAQPVIKSIKLI
ncbi:MAG: peptidylprolyl isomerase [Lachnospiraceae bacterium]|nr:peptidylprolyl isomerase [Lachnospiraceae bacterium]